MKFVIWWENIGVLATLNLKLTGICCTSSEPIIEFLSVM